MFGGPWEPFVLERAASTSKNGRSPEDHHHHHHHQDHHQEHQQHDNHQHGAAADASSGHDASDPRRTEETTSDNDYGPLKPVQNLENSSMYRRRNQNGMAFVLGLCLIVVQCIVQVGNAVLTQYMFDHLEVQSPVLMTYIGMSMLTLLLPIEWWRDRRKLRRQEQQRQHQQHLADGGKINGDYYHHHADGGGGVGVCNINILDSVPSFDSFADDMDRLKNIPLEQSFHGVPASFLDIAQRRTNDLLQDHVRPWNNRKHVMAALLLQPAMFLADWLLNASLRNTTVSAATVLFSLQSVFVYVVSSCVLKLETSTVLKSIGVICGITGTVLTTLHDEANADDTNDDEYTTDGAILVGDSVAVTTKGDLLAIAAAGFYAMYTIQVRQYCSDNEELYSLPLLLGYIGLVSIVATSPIVLLTTSKEVFLGISLGTFGLMLIKGIFDFIVSDYLMFRSVILTSPTIATAGLGLSIPLAFAADLFLQFTETYDDFVLDWYSCSGAAICLFGFLFVNLDSSGVDDDDYDGGDAKDVDGNDAVGDFQMMEDRRYDAKEENRII